jgi:hypothetical protein
LASFVVFVRRFVALSTLSSAPGGNERTIMNLRIASPIPLFLPF